MLAWGSCVTSVVDVPTVAAALFLVASVVARIRQEIVYDEPEAAAPTRQDAVLTESRDRLAPAKG